MTFWEGKRVLVTGAGGFAGSNVCRSLQSRGADVSAMVRDMAKISNLDALDVKVVKGDITDADSLKPLMKGVDVVFHSAANIQIEQTRKDPEATLRANIIGTFNVGNVAMAAGVKKMVHVSTCHVYGNQPEKELPIHETTTPNPHDIYAISKLSSEMVLKPLIEQKFDIVITRAFNHYGPGQVGNFFTSNTIRQLLGGVVPTLGNPNPTRDYTYVKDIADGYLLAAEKGKTGEIYHFSSGKETTIGDMYKKIADACGMREIAAVWKDSRPQDMNRSFGDSTKAKKDLGWEPTTSLEDGLKMTVDWWKNHTELWKDKE